MVSERDAIRTYTLIGATRKARKLLPQDKEAILYKEGKPYIYLTLKATGEMNMYGKHKPAFMTAVVEQGFNIYDYCHYSLDNLAGAESFYQIACNRYTRKGYKVIKEGKKANRFYKDLVKKALEQ